VRNNYRATDKPFNTPRGSILYNMPRACAIRRPALCVIEWKTDNGGREAALDVTSRHATTKCNRDNSVIENTADTA